MTKYKAIRTELNGITFASKREAARYVELLLMERQGVIDRLELQPSYECTVQGRNVCRYVADFRYFCRARNRWVTEDIKGFETPVFKLKKKLVEALYYPLKIEVVK